MHVSLIGGGWSGVAAPAVFGPFLAAAAGVAHDAPPAIACLVVDEGDGTAAFARFATPLGGAGPCSPFPVLVPVGSTLDIAALDDAHGLLVCGGLTPAYAAALAPAREALVGMLHERGVPYAGFSAGAAVAAGRAVVGGWLHRGVAVCPEDAGEDLEEVTVVAGLGLVDWSVEVHAAQWGTVPRLRAALSDMPPGAAGVAVDEDTVVIVDGGCVSVRGLGSVTALRVDSDGVVGAIDPGSLLSAGRER